VRWWWSAGCCARTAGRSSLELATWVARVRTGCGWAWRAEFSDRRYTRAARHCLQRRMPADHPPGAQAAGPRPFVTVAYVPGRAATLGPAVMPQSCVHASQGDSACALVVHHVRARKTGPQVPVTVMQCRTHRRAFTLYPLGHVPYGRVAVAPVGLDGEVLFSTESEPLADSKRSSAWRATQFGPALAAIADPTVKLTDPRWWVTETPARLAQSAALLGVHPVLLVPVADEIAFRLEIPRLVLRQAADKYARARARADRGRVLVGVLAQLGADACLLDRVLAAGTCAGCWRTVMPWDVANVAWVRPNMGVRANRFAPTWGPRESVRSHVGVRANRFAPTWGSARIGSLPRGSTERVRFHARNDL